MATLFPAIGQWFEDGTTNQLFEVVAIDQKSNTIEIQYADGDISEIDPENWHQSSFFPAEAPEDGNAAYGFSAEDHWIDDIASSNNYANPLEFIEPDSFQGFDDL